MVFLLLFVLNIKLCLRMICEPRYIISSVFLIKSHIFFEDVSGGKVLEVSKAKKDE